MSVVNFVGANRVSPVVDGAALYHKGKPEHPDNVRGVRYRLADGRQFTLSSEDCRSLPEGFPRWDLPEGEDGCLLTTSPT